MPSAGKFLRSDNAATNSALSGVRRWSLIFRAKAAHLIRRVRATLLRRAHRKSRPLSILPHACPCLDANWQSAEINKWTTIELDAVAQPVGAGARSPRRPLSGRI